MAFNIKIYRLATSISFYLTFCSLYLIYRTFFFDLYSFFWITVDYLAAFCIASFALLVLIRVALIVKSKQLLWFFVEILLLIVTSINFFVFDDNNGNFVRFKINQSAYYNLITNANSVVPPAKTMKVFWLKEHKIFVFPWPGGIGDNWVGVVYDKSNTLLKMFQTKKGMNNTGEFFDNTTEFLHDLQHVEFLEDGWYLCYFS